MLASSAETVPDTTADTESPGTTETICVPNWVTMVLRIATVLTDTVPETTLVAAPGFATHITAPVAVAPGVAVVTSIFSETVPVPTVTVPETTAETERPATTETVPETRAVPECPALIATRMAVEEAAGCPVVVKSAPETATVAVWVGASHTTAPVTAAWVVVAKAVEPPRETFNVCVGASHTTTPVTAAWVVVTLTFWAVTVPDTTAETDRPGTTVTT
jgi:hypothetical protein